jgi:hypothetical protein
MGSTRTARRAGTQHARADQEDHGRAGGEGYGIVVRLLAVRDHVWPTAAD